MKRLTVALVAVGLLALPSPVRALTKFTDLVVFPTKTGFRAAVAWQASSLVSGVVRYGTSPGALTSTAAPFPGLPDRAQMAYLNGLAIGTTYYVQVEDTLSGDLSEIATFTAANAYNDWNGSLYTQNLVVQLDAQSLPDSVRYDQSLLEIAEGVNVFAERTYDALDSYARIGKVLVMDSLDYPVNVPFLPVQECQGRGTNLADVLFETVPPADTHTFGGYAINDKCTQVYIGRAALLGTPWPSDGGLLLGWAMAHEWMHYAFSTPDLYGGGSNGNCVNYVLDISLMHNSGGYIGGRWHKTELDRSPSETPCDHGSQPWSWDKVQQRYPNVPDGPVQGIIDRRAKGNPDGDALEIWILDRTPLGSTLTRYIPPDGV